MRRWGERRIDVSPKAIELAQRRAETDGVAERTTFICQPLEKANLAVS